MSIFGQVWLWSVAAFLVGVLLTWLLLVRPAQARSRALERRLQAAQAAATERQSAPTPPTRTIDTEPAPRAPEPAPVTEHVRPVEEPEPVAAPEPNWYDRDSFGGRAPEPDESLAGSESDVEKTSIFTAHQKPEPERGSLFDPEAEAVERGALFVHEPEGDAEPERGSLFDPNAEPGRGSLFGQSVEPEAERGSLFAPDAERGHRYAPEPEPEQSYGSHAAVEKEPPAYAFGSGQLDSPVEEEASAESTAILPKRQPRSTPPSSFEPPRPSMRSIERREPVVDEGGRSGSLFEPSVRPNSAGAHAVAPEPAPNPPPARSHAADGSIPPGPFGPGSAMPRPGGGRPSDEFAVKASVTALRYCTEDSPQFGRMVAEVWFRSPADAERVGFRPLS